MFHTIAIFVFNKNLLKPCGWLKISAMVDRYEQDIYKENGRD